MLTEPQIEKYEFGRGDICVCGAGKLGVITGSAPDKSGVWRGVHLEPGREGEQWQSKLPKKIGAKETRLGMSGPHLVINDDTRLTTAFAKEEIPAVKECPDELSVLGLIAAIGVWIILMLMITAASWRDDDSPQAERTFGVCAYALCDACGVEVDTPKADC